MSNPTIRFASISGIVLATLAGCGPGPVSFGDAFYSSPRHKRVAVLPFDHADGEAGSANDGEIVAALLTDALVAVRTYRVTERAKLRKILAEHESSALSFVQEHGLEKAGDLLDADVLVMGNVNRFHQVGGVWPSAELSLSARCVDVKSGDIVWAVSPDMKAFGNLRQLTKSLCRDIASTIKAEYENASRPGTSAGPSADRNSAKVRPSVGRPDRKTAPPPASESVGPEQDVSPAGSTGARSAWPRRHRVREGDTLSHLSEYYYDSGRFVLHILQANRQIENPHELKIGQMIIIPAPPALAKTEAGEP
ncbi:MAG: LysM peptidoglycan-binding domain-containing protein [Phycisphaerales bacterium]|nr:LysM peptidoglycan-binding domain-containing protein [Phycisphaerales bacterium]